jgi:hypothetical protein
LRTLRFAIEQLKDWYPRLFLEPHSVACVAVVSRYSPSPATFDVVCEGVRSRWLDRENALRLEVSWTAETAGKAGRLLATMQQKPVVELAAVALTFLLARRLLRAGSAGFERLRRAGRLPVAWCRMRAGGQRHGGPFGAGTPAPREGGPGAGQYLRVGRVRGRVRLFVPGTSHSGFPARPGGGMTWRKRRRSRTPRPCGS